MTKKDVLRRIQWLCDDAGSQSAWARSKSLSKSQLSEILNGQREPTPAVLTAAGVERVPVSYRLIEGPKK